MTKVVADITISLDGFVTGPDADPKHGLGHGGEPMHRWVESGDEVDDRILARSTERSGAVVMGRNLFDVVDGPDGWSDEMGYGAHEVGTPPFFVVTHHPPDHVRLGLDFTFVTDGVAAAVEQAREVAGDKDVFVMGGGSVIRQAMDEGLVEELVLHISPMIVGRGTPLFQGARLRELTQRGVEVSPAATHVTYDVGS